MVGGDHNRETVPNPELLPHYFPKIGRLGRIAPAGNHEEVSGAEWPGCFWRSFCGTTASRAA
jgi:hypothetical protein